MPRFVLLHHAWPAPQAGQHLDLMLEAGSRLRTWTLSHWPPFGEGTEAWERAPHRRRYLDYEGPLSGGRGSVRQVDRGTYDLLEDAADHLSLRLLGASCQGLLDLHRRREKVWWLQWRHVAP